MSTNAVIAKNSAPDFGKWCHWDGYPAWVGKCLCELIQRDGIDVALTTLVDENLGWSELDPNQTGVIEHPDVHPEARFFAVPGYGIAYTAEQAGDNPNHCVEDETWGYLVSDDGVIELFYQGKPKGIVNAYSETYAEELAAIEDEVYGG